MFQPITLREAIQKVDRSDDNTNDGDFQVFNESMDLGLFGYYAGFGERVKQHYLLNWMCTDTWVGTAVYYFDGEPVAVSTQTARKSDEHVKFVSIEAYNKIREFMLSLVNDEEDTTSPDLVNLNQTFEPTFTVDYSSQLLTNDGWVNGRPATVIKKFHKYTEIDDWCFVIVQYDNGESEKIAMCDFKIPMKLTV